VKRSRSKWSLLAVLAMVFAMVPLTAASAAPASGVFLSELHYDNSGGDVGEFFEVTGDKGEDLTGWSVALYNGSNGEVYNTIDITSTIPDEDGSQGAVAFFLPPNGIQNGAPDGLALVDDGGAVIEFLSYEGTLTAVDGPANGTTSTDIGVAELGSPIGESLQVLAGVWTGPAAESPGLLNGGSAPPPPPATGVFVSELHYDNAGSDVGEFVEVTGAAGGDLAGWSVELYNGSSSQLNVYATISLSGVIPDEDGSQGAVAFFHTGIQNGAPDGLALVDAGGGVVEFWSYEGTFTPTSGSAVGMTSIDMGVSESSSTPVGHSLQVLSGIWTGPADDSPGLLNTEPPPPPTATEEMIHDVQGPGLASPLEGQQVIVEGVVTSDQQDGDFNGWFMQELDADHDADPMTSEGIFIFEGGNTVEVNVGDIVKLEGTVVEFFGETQIRDIVDVEVTGNGSFTATVVTLPFADFAQPEWYEGMYIVVPQELTISEYFNFDRFGEIVLTVGRPPTPTAVYDPGSPEQAALALENALGRITLDDNRTSQNPDPAIHPNGADFDLDNLFRGGDIVENTTGVISYSFGLYRIQPTQGADYTPTNARQASPDAVGGSLSVATFNVLNYFTTIDDSGSICGPDQNAGCRGADSPEEFERQRTKIIAAIAAINADVVGLMEIENYKAGGVDVPLTDLVDGVNAVVGAGTYAAVETGPIGSDAIKVALIYKPATVSLDGAYAVLDSSVDPTFNDEKNRPALAQTFTQTSNGESVTVAVNHLKSKGSSCSGDPDLGDGAGNCNLTRTSAAEALVTWLAADATGSGEDDVMIIGDLNSYDKEDPIDAIIAGGYSDLVADFGGEFAYSYVFSGQWGYLDYAMANGALQSAVTGTTVWHINADEPDILDYDLSFKKPAQQALYEPNAFRASDHDPVIVGLELDRTPPVVTADLVPDRGRFFTVEFSCVDAGDSDPTCVGDINGVSVEDGQTVALIWSNGKAKSWHEGPTLFIKDSSFTLTVVGTDNAGNTATAVKVL
jgi:predicted extracellular nuclease